MPSNNNQKEYIDIPLNIDDTPLHLFEKFTPPTIATDPVDAGFEFISRIDSAIRSPDCPNELLSLYLNHFEIASSQRFT